MQNFTKEQLDVWAINRHSEDEKSSISSDSIKAIKESQLLNSLLSESEGGLNSLWACIIQDSRSIAAVNPSVSWVACLMACHSRLIYGFPAEVITKIFSINSKQFVATATVCKEIHIDEIASGYLLSGTWLFSTLVEHADWIIASGLNKNLGNEEYAFLIPGASAQKIESLRLKGLRATNTKSFSVNNVYVPYSHCVPLKKLYGRANSSYGLTVNFNLASNFIPYFTTTILGVALGLVESSASFAMSELKFENNVDYPISQKLRKLSELVSLLDIARDSFYAMVGALNTSQSTGVNWKKHELGLLRFKRSELIKMLNEIHCGFEKLLSYENLKCGSKIEMNSRDLSVLSSHSDAGSKKAFYEIGAQEYV